MTFYGQLMSSSGLIIYESKRLKFVHGRIIIPDNTKYVPLPGIMDYYINGSTVYDLTYFPKGHPSRLGLFGIQVTYTSSNGHKCFCFLRTDKWNQFKALWTHKQFRNIQNKTFRNTMLGILIGIVVATYTFGLKQCNRTKQSHDNTDQHPIPDSISKVK